MDHSIVANQANKVFKGLVRVFLASQQLAANLVGMAKPVTLFNLLAGAVGSTFRQSAFLTGGDGTPTAATSNFTLTGSILAGTTLRIIFHGIPLGTGATLAAGPYYDVYCEYDIQSGNTLTTAANGLKAVINIAVAGTGSITTGRIYAPDFPTVTKAQIGTGMALKYAAATGTSPNIIINGAATGGTTQNEYDYTVECCPKPPGLLSFSTDTYPTLPGLSYLGATQGASLAFSATTATIDTDQSYQPLDTYLTATTAQLTLNALQDRSPRTIRELQQIAGVASSNNYDIVAPNFYASAPNRCVILQTDSQEFPGNPEFAILRTIKSFNITFGLQKAHQPVASTFDLVAGDTEDICHLLLYRPSISA